MGISKTDYIRGMQCEKMLWLDRHKPQEKIIPPETQALLDRGNEFGDSLMGIFGEYEEVTTLKENGRLDYGGMIAKTKDCLKRNVPVICEAAFSFYMNYCAVDILRKAPDGYEIYEVKNSSEIKQTFLRDVGFQTYILKKCGVNVVRSYLVYHIEEPYKIEEITAQAREFEREAARMLFRLSDVKKSETEPSVCMGTHCDEPYECWYKAYCASLKGD